MNRRGIVLGSRLAVLALALGLGLFITGDGGRAATVPATVYGQDPLEVLKLQVRPNVVVVLDSSGSMTSRVPGGDTGSGDHPRSRLYQAKEVLRQVVAQNEDKASFMFGSYTQVGSRMGNRSAGDDRFQYYTSSELSPNMLSSEITIQRARNDTGDRGFQAWQWIDVRWNTLWFDTGGATCSASVPAGFYQTGSSLARVLQNAMNATSCGSNFIVGYQPWDGRFTIERSSGVLDVHWGDGGPNNIAEALGGRGGTDYISDYPHMLLYREGGGSSGWIDFQFSETIDGTTVQFYQVRAGRLWNGETLRVQADGTICGIDFGSAATRTSPPSFTVQVVRDNCGSDITGERAVFTFAGADFGGNSRSCRGFMPKVGIIPCDLAPPPTQISTIGPYIDLELPFDPDGTAQNYTERMDGSWAVDTFPLDSQGGAKADGFTPIANSLIDIRGTAGGSCLDVTDSNGNGITNELVTCPRRNFEQWWEVGPDLASPFTNPAWATVAPAGQRAIKNHLDPKEKTIVLFVTDGDDTCGSIQDSGSGGTDDNAKRAAFYAERLYSRIDPAEPASSVQTFVIGFGGAFSGGEPTRLNWIAWGGSGLGQGLPGQPNVPTSGDYWSGDNDAFRALRAQCTTCQDAFVAPDAATLADQLQAIIDQGASTGEFTAQQSLVETVFEYVDLATTGDDIFDARTPQTSEQTSSPRRRSRYEALVPTRFVSSFSLPGFRGHIRAVQNDGSGNPVIRWDAGELLTLMVQGGMSSVCSATGAECTFAQLHGNGFVANAAIKRRIYTTSRNGVYTYSAENLVRYGEGMWAPPERLDLWPPSTSIAPDDYTSAGSLDDALGIAGLSLVELQGQFLACQGTNLPSQCGSTSGARREAREMILAFMAGAEPVPEGSGVKRDVNGRVLYKARSWVLADSELATSAVVSPPLPTEPLATPYITEYELFRDGPRDPATGQNPGTSAIQVQQGFGLRNPDADGSVSPGQTDGRVNLKPVMTVLYAPGNDMLHAFRAGPCYSPSTSPGNCQGGNAPEHGGEELWGFVPYDQLGALRLRYINDPQGRDNHVYMLARAIRFSDIFVPVPEQDRPYTATIGGQAEEIRGVWRRVMYVPRGIGGKYLTALDVTGPGPYTTARLATKGPVPLWSRGNPDTEDGTPTGPSSGTAADLTAYSSMGETWSLPAVGWMDQPFYETARRGGRLGCSPSGGDPGCKVEHALFVGSGYGEPGEGTTVYTLDALTGDVLASVDVEAAAATYGLTRPLGTVDYPNAVVANVVGYNPAAFEPLETTHPAAAAVTRVYVGDLHGRLWKILAGEPGTALPVADLGADQPVGTAVSLLGAAAGGSERVPHIYLSSGNDSRAEGLPTGGTGPFKNFAFRDDGGDVDTTLGSPVPFTGDTTVEAFPPSSTLFVRPYDQGTPETDCGYADEAVFRGTVQPAAAFACTGGISNGNCTGEVGNVFFGGTRLSPPNSRFAPPTPYACGTGQYPCRSVFDSILYVLGATSGQAAYDLNASGDDAYRIFRDSRIVAISMQADPETGGGGSSFVADEGLAAAVPEPPPPPGLPPTTTSATANVVMKREPGQPPPSVHYGSTVCQ